MKTIIKKQIVTEFSNRKYPTLLAVRCLTGVISFFYLILPVSSQAITFNKSTFEPHVHDTFTVNVGSEGIEMQLIQIIDSSDEKMESFVLQFLSLQSTIFQQKIYSMKHDELGDFSLFLVPSGKDDKGTYYEAVFTRILP